MPRSTHSRMVRASGTVLTWKIPGRSMPGRGEADRKRAGRQDQLVVGLGRDFAGLDVAQVDRFLFGEMEIASQFVRASMAKCARKYCSLATRRLDSFGITPPTCDTAVRSSHTRRTVHARP